MVTYTIEALSSILIEVPSIKGRPTFKDLWDAVPVLLPMLCKITHPDHPVEGMTEMMMEATAYDLVSIRPWLVTDRLGGVFCDSRWCITETDQ